VLLKTLNIGNMMSDENIQLVVALVVSIVFILYVYFSPIP